MNSSGFPCGSAVKNPPAIQETQEIWVQSLGGEDSLQYSCLENPVDRGAWWATVHSVANSSIGLKQLSAYAHMNSLRGLPWWLCGKESACQCRRRRFNSWVRNVPWRRKWQHTPVFLPEKSHGQRTLVGYRPWDHKRIGHNLVTEDYETL